MRPDYTLSLWPADFDEREAEAQELMVHVHFDAKYRIESVEQLFGNDDIDLNAEKQDQREGRYKRADLLKMHAYRDAIRRTQGAYVLYPGDSSRQWRGYHEILPGLGAFPIKPGNGEQAVEKFIREIVAHACDRATARERQSYHTYQVQEAPAAYSVLRAFPERAAASFSRHAPPAETFVLVGWNKNEAHLKWIVREKLYNFRMDTRAGSLPFEPKIIAAQYLLLHGEGANAVPGLLRITSKGPRIFSKDALMRLRYPGEPKGDFYLVYDVELAPEFDGFCWNYAKLPGRPAGRKSAWPFAVTLDAVLATAKEHLLAGAGGG
jgi:PD-(D/E)XK nuclease superfamily